MEDWSFPANHAGSCCASQMTRACGCATPRRPQGGGTVCAPPAPRAWALRATYDAGSYPTATGRVVSRRSPPAALVIDAACRSGGAGLPGAGEAHLRVPGSAVTRPDEGLRAAAPGTADGLSDSRREVQTVPDNIVLIMRFHPVGGEDVSVVSEDFAGEREALEAIARALDERRGLVLTHARYDREADQNGVIINLANVVSVRVSTTDSAATGQYL